MQTRTAEGTSTSTPMGGARREWSWTPALLESPVHHSELAAVYKAWAKHRRNGSLPALTDFSIDDLTPWLGRISVATATRGDFEIELIGCSLINESGEEISRVLLSESKLGPVGPSARDMLETVTGMGIVALPCGSTEWRNQSIGWHGIALPLAGSAALICLFTAQ